MVNVTNVTELTNSTNEINWEALKPVDDRLLTQLGGCTVVGPGGTPLFNWLDRGLCDVVDFEEVVEAI